MTHIPLFSIITVVYNDAANLEKTIQSVVGQTNHNYEYIVIDGGSKDGTIDVIKQHQTQITLWKSEPDKGIYDAMNKGIKAARGKFINFLNAGDTYFSPNVLQLVSETQARLPQVEIVYGQAVRRSSESSNLKFIKGGQVTTSNLFTSIPFCHQAIFYQTPLFQEVGLYDITYRVTADYQWLIRYYNSRQTLAKMHFLNSNLVEYAEGGYSFINIHKAAREKLKIARTHFNKPYRAIGIFSFSCFIVKSYAIEWLGKFHLLEGYRHLKYRLLKKAIPS
jgi:glycosyltransferase involved in cell wall biosynthesis